MKVAVLFFSFVLIAAAQQTTERPKELELLFQAKTLGMISSSQLEELLRLASEETFRIISSSQLEELLRLASETGEGQKYNRPTQLNVLYFFIILVIVVVYIPLMVLAVKHCTMRELSLVMIGHTLALVGAGLLLSWATDYQFLGGL